MKLSDQALARWSAKATPDQHLTAWLAYVDALPWTPGKLNELEFAALRAAHLHRIEPEFACSSVLEKMKLCGAKNIRQYKVRQSLERIYSERELASTSLCAPAHRADRREVEYDSAYAETFAANLPAASNHEWFLERSILTCPNRSVAGFLHVIFEPGETVFITTKFDATSLSDKAWLWTNPSPLGKERLELDCLDFLKSGQPNVWFLSNPVSGQSHCDDRLRGGRSFRCVETITSWCHYVIETDVVTDSTWLSILAQLPLRIKAIYHSGKRGFHALAQLEAKDKQEAEELIAKLEPELVRLGACPGTLTTHRLTRMPNCLRTVESNGEMVERLQRLIYLNPKPTGQPIWALPIREPAWAVWLRWAESLLAAGVHPSALNKRRVLAGLRPFAGLYAQVDQAIQNLQNR
jgi:hypothetical protein